MTDGRFSSLKLNNKGLSLTELIIAIAIGAIVSASIAALITFSIRAYRNESVNTSMQYELQTSLNLAMDEIMGASAVVIRQNPDTNPTDEGKPYSRYAMFGKYTHNAAGAVTHFKGVIFVSSSAVDGKFKIYMNRIDMDVSGTVTAFANARYNEVKNKFSTTPNPYLLAENVTKFVIQPDPDGVCFDTSVTPPTYTNPLPVRVEMKFKRTGWGDREFEKHVKDVTYLRNKVTDDIFINSSNNDNTFVTYRFFKKD